MALMRPYHVEQDREATRRIWKECGWIDPGEEEKTLDLFLSGGRNLVAELKGEAECLASARSGDLRYLDQMLRFSAVVAVTTSRVARRLKLARQLTARLVAEEAEAGAQVSGLGIFDSGFYDQLGYGLGGYEVIRYFDPAQLSLRVRRRTPVRLGKEDYRRVMDCLARRHRGHGSINIDDECFYHAEMAWSTSCFGLGFENEQGELSHFIWCRAKGEEGPYRVLAMAWQNREHYLELLGLIRSLSDQILSIGLVEHPDIQLQQLLKRPFRMRSLTSKSDKATRHEALSYWQARICDLPGCITALRLPVEGPSFNLQLEDPITEYLEEGRAWRGIGGAYTVRLGQASSIEQGHREGLPLLSATVASFTRLWLGVQPASGLCVTDAFEAGHDLVRELDQCLRLPRPSYGIDF